MPFLLVFFAMASLGPAHAQENSREMHTIRYAPHPLPQGVQELRPEVAAEPSDWRIKFFGGLANHPANTFIGIWQGDIDLEDTAFAGIEVQRVIARDMLNLPIDASLYGGIIRRFEKGYQDDFFTFNGGVRVDWKVDETPIAKHIMIIPMWVRTRIFFAAGASYAEGISKTEQEALAGEKTAHFLVHLNSGVSFEMRDLINLVVEVGPNSFWECVRLEVGIDHRSGAFGTVNGVDGGDNGTYIGISCDVGQWIRSYSNSY